MLYIFKSSPFSQINCCCCCFVCNSSKLSHGQYKQLAHENHQCHHQQRADLDTWRSCPPSAASRQAQHSSHRHLQLPIPSLPNSACAQRQLNNLTLNQPLAENWGLRMVPRPCWEGRKGGDQLQCA